MAWKEIKLDQLANTLSIEPNEVLEKQNLIRTIIRLRKKKGLTQADLAKKANISQGRIAQIESGIGTRKVSFDVILNLLGLLELDFHIVTKKKIAA